MLGLLEWVAALNQWGKGLHLFWALWILFSPGFSLVEEFVFQRILTGVRLSRSAPRFHLERPCCVNTRGRSHRRRHTLRLHQRGFHKEYIIASPPIKVTGRNAWRNLTQTRLTVCCRQAWRNCCESGLPTLAQHPLLTHVSRNQCKNKPDLWCIQWSKPKCQSQTGFIVMERQCQQTCSTDLPVPRRDARIRDASYVNRALEVRLPVHIIMRIITVNWVWSRDTDMESYGYSHGDVPSQTDAGDDVYCHRRQARK